MGVESPPWSIVFAFCGHTAVDSHCVCVRESGLVSPVSQKISCGFVSVCVFLYVCVCVVVGGGGIRARGNGADGGFDISTAVCQALLHHVPMGSL